MHACANQTLVNNFIVERIRSFVFRDLSRGTSANGRRQRARTADQPAARKSVSDGWWEGKLAAEEDARTSEVRAVSQARDAEDAEAAARQREAAYQAVAAENAEKRASRYSTASRAAGGAPSRPKHMTTAQVRKALREAGVEPPEEASRAELEAMLKKADEHV